MKVAFSLGDDKYLLEATENEIAQLLGCTEAHEIEPILTGNEIELWERYKTCKLSEASEQLAEITKQLVSYKRF